MRLGVIGRGVHGQRYIDHINEAANLELMWAAGRRGFTPAQADLVDGIVIASPPETHASYIAQATANRKYILVEKPMTTTAADAQFVVDECSRVMVAHTMRWNESVNAAILAGVMDAEYIRLGLNLAHEDRFTLGPLQDHAVHLIDLARYMTGQEIAIIEGARGTVLHYTDECPYVQVRMHMANKAIIDLEVDEGIGGRYSFVEWRGRKSGIQPLASPPTIPKVLQSFVAGAKRGNFHCDAWDGLQVARAVEAIVRSASIGKPHVLCNRHRTQPGGTFAPWVR